MTRKLIVYDESGVQGIDDIPVHKPDPKYAWSREDNIVGKAEVGLHNLLKRAKARGITGGLTDPRVKSAAEMILANLRWQVGRDFEIDVEGDDNVTIIKKG